MKSIEGQKDFVPVKKFCGQKTKLKKDLASVKQQTFFARVNL